MDNNRRQEREVGRCKKSQYELSIRKENRKAKSGDVCTVYKIRYRGEAEVKGQHKTT